MVSKDTIKSLKKDNDDLKAETESIMQELKKVKELANSKDINLARYDHICLNSNKEILKSLDYLSKEYDDQKRFTQAVKQQFSRLESRVTEIAVKLDSLSNSIDEFQQYSYQYNIKLVGIPEIKANESATETSVLVTQIANDQNLLFVNLHDVSHENKRWRRDETYGKLIRLVLVYLKICPSRMQVYSLPSNP